MDLATLWSTLSATALDLGLKILASLAFLVLGRWLIQRVVRVTQAAMARAQVDATLIRYLGSVLAVLLNIVLGVGILGYLGVETTSIAALLAGAGLAIGTAWSGLLSHFASGAFILVLRPFKVGDYVQAGGVEGTVVEIGLFGTTIVNPQNVTTIVGNGKIMAETILNYSSLPVRRVELTAQLDNSVDPLEAVRLFTAGIAEVSNVATSPAPEVTILSFTLAGPVIAVRPYCHTNHYWQVYFDTNAMIARVGAASRWPVPALVRVHKNLEGTADVAVDARPTQ